MNLQKIFSATLGLVCLAGLAMHQGNSGTGDEVDTSVLMGTALDQPADGAVEAASQADSALTNQEVCEEDEMNPSADSSGSKACESGSTSNDTHPETRDV